MSCIFKQSLAGYGDQSTYKYKWDMSVMVAQITTTLIITCICVEVWMHVGVYREIEYIEAEHGETDVAVA